MYIDNVQRGLRAQKRYMGIPCLHPTPLEVLLQCQIISVVDLWFLPALHYGSFHTNDAID